MTRFASLPSEIVSLVVQSGPELLNLLPQPHNIFEYIPASRPQFTEGPGTCVRYCKGCGVPGRKPVAVRVFWGLKGLAWDESTVGVGETAQIQIPAPPLDVW